MTHQRDCLPFLRGGHAQNYKPFLTIDLGCGNVILVILLPSGKAGVSLGPRGLFPGSLRVMIPGGRGGSPKTFFSF